MYKRLFIFAIGLFLLTSASSLQSKDSRGRDFVFTFLPNFHQTYKEPFDSLAIYVTGLQGTVGTIDYRSFDGQPYKKPFIIPANGVYLYQLHWRNFELQGIMQYGVKNVNKQNNLIAAQSFRITTDNDVSVYALNKTYKSSDATIVFPVNVLGKEYVVASFNSDEPNNPDSGGNFQNAFAPSEFAVVATEDNTHIDFDLSCRAYSHGTAPFSRDLNAGDCFLIQTPADSGGTFDDLTGSYVKSNKPIAVFGGHQRAVIPNGFRDVLVSRDQIYEQMIPMESLGKMYIIAPLADPAQSVNIGYDVYRIIAAYDSTEIFVNGVSKGIYKRGKFYEGKLDNAFMVTASKQVLAAQYQQTTGIAYGDTMMLSYLGDPFMLIVPPKKQYLTDYITYNIQAKDFNGIDTVDIYENQFITVITPTVYISAIKMDDKYLESRNFTSIGNTCYSYASFLATTGAHRFTGEKPFGVYVYGFGYADSYGYNGGMNFEVNVETIPAAKGDAQICLGDSTQLKAEGCRFVTWTPAKSLSDPNIKNPMAFPKKTTLYIAYMTDSLGCVTTDSVRVTVVSSPLIDAGRDTTFCHGNFTVLKPSGGLEYRWDYNQSLSCTDCKNPAATPIKSTWYYVTSKDSNGCQGRDSVYITVNPLPNIYAGRDTVTCIGNSFEFRPRGGTYYEWDYEPSLSCTECDNPIATPTTKTTYYVTGYNKYGCVARDSITLDVFPSKLIDAGKDTSICTESATILNPSGGSNYLWDANPTLSCLDCQNPIASPTKEEIYFVTATDTNGCIGRDSVKVSISPDYTLTVSNDTTVCIGQKAVLTAKGGFSYRWSPKDKVICDTCDITESIIDSSMTFYVRSENGNGCQKTDSIFVKAVVCSIDFNSVVFPLDVYCDDETKVCSINNSGELPLRLDSTILDGPDKNNFRLINTGQFPLLIPKAKSYDFDVQFLPDTKTIYSAYIKVYSMFNYVDTIKIIAEKRIAVLNLSATMEGGSQPGDTSTIKINIQSEDWTRIHLKHLSLKLKYKYFKLFANESQFKLCGTMPDNWDCQNNNEYDVPNQLEIWNLNIFGKSELTGNTCLTIVKPIYMLHPTVLYEIEVTGDVPENDICAQVIGAKSDITLNYCVDTLRAVQIGKGEFAYEIPNQVCTNKLLSEAHVPFDADVEISIVDLLGQEKPIFTGRLSQGYTKFDHDITNYPAGIYFICFRSGQVIITRKVIINTN